MGGWVGGWVVKRDFRTHSGSSEHSLDSESKFEPSVAIRTPKAIVQDFFLALMKKTNFIARTRDYDLLTNKDF